MSLYEINIKSHQTCTHMKQIYSCTDIYKDPVVHIKQIVRAVNLCTSLKQVYIDNYRK